MSMAGLLCTICGAQVYFLIYYRSSSSVVTLRQFVKDLCLFVNLEYR